MTRRQFLIGAGVAGAGLLLGVRLGVPAVRLRVAQAVEDGGQPNKVDAAPTAWFEINPDNRVRLHLPKVEMGQGVHTALAQIAAEDLAVDWGQIEVVHASTARGFDPGLMMTAGSTTISDLYLPLREAGAILRDLLRAEAARQMNLPVEALTAEAGTVSASGDTSHRLTYGEIVKNKIGEWELPKTPAALKPPGEFVYIGKPMPRLDFPTKIQGTAVYGYDFRLPDMLYGAVARPVKLGSTLRNAKPGQAPNKPGVVQVVTEGDFAGVVANTRAQALDALSALQLEWTPGLSTQQAEIESLTTVKNGQGTVIQIIGEPDANLKQGTPLVAEYRTPLAAHANLEPQAALADVKPDKVTVWVSSQSPGLLRGEIAKALGRNENEVEVTATYLGGGFGRRLNVEVAIEAARLSAAAGRPVHVGWTRRDEFRNGAFRPPTHHVLRGTLGADGRVLAIEHQQASGNVSPAIVGMLFGADFGACRGATIRYNIPHRRTTAQPVTLPVPTTFWRGLGLLANVFAVESFLDELAHAAGADPLQFHLQHLPEGKLGDRLRAVLERAAELSGWATPAPDGRARGLACSVDMQTVVAQVAEVSVEAGKIHVHKFSSVVDCGLVVNPNIAAAQTEGAIIMGLSSTLFEELRVKDGQIEVVNFDKYPLLTIKDAPEIETAFVESSDKPYGMGEPPLGPVAGAVANAVFALTGQRLRRLPLQLA